MALVTGIDWTTQIITISRLGMALKQTVPIEIRVLDINELHLELRALNSTVEWRHHNWTHNRNAPTNVSGVVLSQVITFLPAFTYTMENGAYIVEFNGANTNLADLVNYNQVSIRPNNSAGLTTSLEQQQLIYNRSITVNQVSGIPGQTYPIGSTLPGKASNNFTDAKFIADLRGFNNFFLEGSNSLTTNTLDFSTGYKFVGSAPLTTVFTLSAAAVVDNCNFYRLTITGALDSKCSVNECIIANLSFFQGFINYSVLTGLIVLGGGNNASFQNCFDHETDSTPPIIDMGGIGQTVTITGYEGYIKIINYADNVTTDINFISGAGKVELDSTVTEGTFIVFKDMEVLDNSGPNCTVIDKTSVRALKDLKEIALNERGLDPITGIETLYELDGTTVKYQGIAYEDNAQTIKYNSNSTKIERRKRLQ